MNCKLVISINFDTSQLKTKNNRNFKSDILKLCLGGQPHLDRKV